MDSDIVSIFNELLIIQKQLDVLNQKRKLCRKSPIFPLPINSQPTKFKIIQAKISYEKNLLDELSAIENKLKTVRQKINIIRGMNPSVF